MHFNAKGVVGELNRFETFGQLGFEDVGQERSSQKVFCIRAWYLL